MDAEADPPGDEAPVSTENTEPLPVVPGSWAAVQRDWEAATGPQPAPPHTPLPPTAPPPTALPPTALPPFDFSAVEMGRVPARRKRALVVAGAAAAALVALGVVGFAVVRSGEDTSAGTDTAAEADFAGHSEAEERLLARLPGGYPDSACQVVEPPQGTAAQVSCEATDEPQAPAATYTLVADEDALTAAFDKMTKRSSVVVCPGRIQSPGPWRRNATPDVVSGIVVCAADREATTVGWTDEASLLLSEIRSEPGSRNLEQLFAWWSSHS
ncbi:hypothetical protein MCHIJ_38550 [Mycolicibacterium chitae]|uniref:Serine/threonine-protein kinase n=1 Tax=Mycolicibacterium chitae TaxID=1792 RepID=A0A3S4S9E9_MYCCI|nr:hypothetical protein [Mycolicibacterium chitae]BBZ04418.1 hypothetical protein MCHIJ_38550 [Mycolicibacterium chitae]VEG48053.1 serine/threonine-protein kinase [Mycolicibacterium chitae]